MAAVTESRRLIPLLTEVFTEGQSYACIVGIDTGEATRRLRATAADDPRVRTLHENPWTTGLSQAQLQSIIGATDVPGGCALTQWAGYVLTTPEVMTALTRGTIGSAMYDNPASGNQGCAYDDGEAIAWDTHPGGGIAPDEYSPADIVRPYLYEDRPVAHCANQAGLRPTDARAFTGPPDIWLRLP